MRLIEPTDTSVNVPHMGWNDVAPLPHAHGHDVLVGGEAYFLHSYHFKLRHHEDVLAMTDHGGGLVAAIGARQFPRRAVPSRKRSGLRARSLVAFPRMEAVTASMLPYPELRS